MIIGLTGGIGSGKSSAAQAFRQLNIPVVDADAVSRRLTGPHGKGSLAVLAHFGPDYIDASGAMDRAKMRERVFSDPEARARLEALLHPLIIEDVSAELAALAADHDLVVYDCPLLLQSDYWQNKVDLIVVVDASQTTRIARVQKRSGLKTDEIRRIMKAQLPRTAMISRADVVLVNEGSVDDLTQNVRRLVEKLRRKAGA